MRARHSLGLATLILAGCGMQAARESARLADDGAMPAVLSEAASGETTPVRADAEVDRKIIYEADISLVVNDLEATEEAIHQLVQSHGGYLADEAIQRETGKELSGRWQARVPVDRYSAFVDEAANLGMPVSRRQKARDVTEEFVDLQARIANKQKLEERVAQLLEKLSGDINEVIEIERELARVRGEIEQMQGRLRYLSNRTEFSTVIISAREERDYVPPQAPTFAARVGGAWSDSLASLKTVGTNGLIGIVYAVPWLLVLGAVLLPLGWRTYRRR